MEINGVGNFATAAKTNVQNTSVETTDTTNKDGGSTTETSGTSVQQTEEVLPPTSTVSSGEEDNTNQGAGTNPGTGLEVDVIV